MKTFFKKSIALALTLLMLITSIPVMNLAGVNLGFTAEAATYKVGDVVQFGSYPQSKVTDSATITALNNKAPEWVDWTSYGYYSGTGSYGTMTQGDWMRYTDVTYNGNKYRGVKFTQYRPYDTLSQSSSNNAYQDDNGYSTNTVYWFKFEPIDWRVLDPATGLVMCETIIDSQPYSNTVYYNSSASDSRYDNFNDALYTNYASDYETSSIRQWLNDDFYNTAFTDSEKKEINISILNNDSYFTSIGTTGYEKLDSNSTNDKIFLLSYNEVRKRKFGFSPDHSDYDEVRRAQGSDYAKCQGLYVYRSSKITYNNNSCWLLRSPGNYSDYSCYVDGDGHSTSCRVSTSRDGVRPALRVNLDTMPLTMQFQGGNGTEKYPYQVSTPEQLNAIRNNLSAYYIQINDIDMSSWGNWIPIGLVNVSDESSESTTKVFTGKYNGQNYKISGLKIYDTNISFSDDCYGLFASISNATLENISLVDIDYMIDKSIIDYAELENKYGIEVGGVVGKTDNSEIKKCLVTGSINVEHCYNAFVGGVVGYNNSNVSECVNKAKIFVNADGTKDSIVNCGGLVGTTHSNDVTLNTNYGDIKAYAGQYAYVGGISGDGGDIANCLNYADISGAVIHGGSCSSFATNCNIGGIVGATYSRVRYCVNYGNVQADSVYTKSWWGCATGSSAGGISGWCGYDGSGSIIKCVNNSDEIYSYTADENGNKIDDDIGRIAGSSISTSDCYSNNKTLINNCLINGTASDKNGASCSTEQLLSKSTYVDFDFENIWEISDELCGAVLKSVNDTSESEADYIVQFGSYPQTEVTDRATITALNNKAPEWEEWTSYGYYTGTDSYGTMKQGDWMRYTDITYNGNKYRGVKFTQYRPYVTYYQSSSNIKNQNNNGYYTNTVYWFKFEPIDWRVLDPATGLVMCETIIDSQPYSNTIYYNSSASNSRYAYFNDAAYTNYASDYETSSIRQWLNDDFYNTAFTDSEKKEINTTTLNNDGYYTSVGTTGQEVLDSVSTNDKIFLLSYNEAINSNFGFSLSDFDYDTARFSQGSDYALCQGLDLYSGSGSTFNNNSSWLLRSPGYSSTYCCVVDYDGSSGSNCSVYSSYNGIRPALRFNIGNSTENGAGSGSTNKKNGSFIITTKQNGYNEKFFELTDVKCYIGDKEIKQNESKFEISQKDIVDDITLKKSGFRDYIIPYKVAKAFSDGYNFDAYMSLSQPDGKAYISSVFAKNSSETQYQDLTKTSMIAENYNTYDIVVTGVGLSAKAKYHIGQDLQHALQSDTGTFEAENLYSELTHNKTAYVYAVDNGKVTDLVEISLSKSNDDGALKRILETSTYSLGGTGGITIKVPDENPIFGNSEISLKAFSAPLTVYYDTTNDTYIGTIGFDLYSYTEKDKTVSNASGSYTKFGDGETKKAFQNFKESFSYFNKTPFAEDEKDKNGKSYKDQWTSFVNRCKTASKYSQKYYDKNFSADFLGYLEFAITEQGFTIKEASLKVGADFSYSYTYQGAVWVIPAYFKATLGASASLEGKGKRAMVNRDIPFEYEITLDIEPKLALEAGIGVEKLAKAGVEAKGTAPFKVEFFNQHITLKFHGEINIKTKAFVFTWDKKLVDGDLDILDKYWGKTKTFALRQTAGVPQYAVLVDDNEEDLTDYYNESTSIADRNYAENTSEWLDNGIMLMASADSEVTVKQLQTSVLEDGKPVAVTFGDKVLMAWVEDCSDRDTFNRMRLMYSIYNGTYWSEPEAVYDDGKNDDAPVLATDGTDVYFAWQKINDTLDENSVVTDALQKVDICTARYDSASGTIKDAKIICSDNGYDYAQTITVDNGKPIVYFASCSDPSVAVSFNSKINKYENNAVSTLVSSLSFVQSIAAAGNDMSFVIDTDGDLSTSDDINAFSYSSGYNTEYEKKDISTAIIGTYYGHIDDEKVMFVTDGTNIYYDLNGERKAVFANSQNISSLNLVEKNGNPAFLWTEDIESGNQICYVGYDGTSWSSPVVLTKAEGYYFDSLDMVSYNDNIVGVFMQDELKYNEDSESYDISQVNLAYVTVEDYMDLKVGSVFVEEETLVPGDTAEICVYVENLGTETINNVEFTLSDSISNVQTTEVEIGLAPGENKNVYIDYTVPENFKQTTLSVCAEIIDETDVDTTNNSLTETIGLPDIRIIKTECALDGNYYVVTAFINNNSVTTASEITAKLWVDEEDGSVYHEAKIENLSNDECGYVQFYVEESSLTFDETNTAKLYLAAESEGSKYGKTATECLLITKSENECGHPITETIIGTDPTCTEDGTSDYVVCLACGENATESEVIPARHSLGDWYISIPAKCELIGKKQRDCSRCDYFETQEIPAVEHNYEAVITPATCYSNGFTTNTCTKCGNGYTSNITAMLTHNFSDWYTVTDATCEANGVEQRDCSACDYLETQNVPATGHNYNNGVCTSCGDDLTANCSCNCHAGGIKGLIFKIILFFQKLFRMNQICEGCGISHY